MQSPILDLGIDIILWLQSLGEWLVTPMRLLSFLGNEEFFLMVMPILYWCLDAGLGLRVGIILLLSNGLNAVLKLVFHSPRPFFYSNRVQVWDSETSFGPPSGHSQTAASVWGMLAATSGRWWPGRQRLVWGLSLLLILLIGISRMYLGMHFPTDVLLGWATGFAVVWAFMKLEAPIGSRLQQQPLARRILAVFGVSLVLVLLAFLARLSLGAWKVPAEWLANAGQVLPDDPPRPLAISGVFTNAGAFFGLAAGALWLSAKGGFSASGPAWKRAARYPLGLIGVLILWFGLGRIFPSGEAFLLYLLRYLRYALVGVWMSALAPLLFIRLGLAEAQPGQPANEELHSQPAPIARQ